jgi:hypothetical protein
MIAVKQYNRIIAGVLVCTPMLFLQSRDAGHIPLPLYTGYIGYNHYPVDRDEPIENSLDVSVQMWGAGYYRNSIDAFGHDNDDNNCGTNNRCLTRSSCGDPNRISLAQLLFGTQSFTIAQSFANGTAVVPGNPFVTVTSISPNFDFTDRGVFFGFVGEMRFGCEDRIHTGIRLALPYREIMAEEQCDADLGASGSGSNGGGIVLQDFYQERQEKISTDQGGGPGTATETNTAWTIRLDFLTSLTQGIDTNGNPIPMVVYNDATNNVTIASQDATGGIPAAGPVNDTAPSFAVIESVNGSIPSSVRWADVPQNGATAIAGDGSGLINLQRGRFASDTSYAALSASPANQATLWVAPNVQGTEFPAATSGIILPGAITAKDAIDIAVNNIQPSVIAFFETTGLDFCNGRNKGLGDLDLEWYVNYERCDYGWAELQFGVRFPTGDRLTAQNVLSPILAPLGNNGHYELRPGLVIASNYWDWMLFKADLTYSIVLKRTEWLPASFVGSTVQNVGPAVAGNVSWGYFYGDIDLTFVHPWNQSLGWNIAYQAYVKQHDKIRYCGTQAPDFTGALQTLDHTLLEANTSRVGHVIRSELFYANNCCNLYGGFSQVVAGKNIARDTDIYLGIMVTF